MKVTVSVTVSSLGLAFIASHIVFLSVPLLKIHATPRVGLVDYYGKPFTTNDVGIVEAERSE